MSGTALSSGRAVRKETPSYKVYRLMVDTDIKHIPTHLRDAVEGKTWGHKKKWNIGVKLSKKGRQHHWEEADGKRSIRKVKSELKHTSIGT